jgi:predicted dehydrogenase
MHEEERYLNFYGQLTSGPRLHVGVIGCGSHAYRNIYPTLQFAPTQLIATCDLDLPRAQAFARQFGAAKAYDNHHDLLTQEDIDAVLIVTNYDAQGRPRYPRLALDCLRAGKHVWIEKPPAFAPEELAEIEPLSTQTGRRFMVGLKKMFTPANEKAAALSRLPDFGKITLLSLQYPTAVPTTEEFARYFGGESVGRVVGFLDHLCHPTSAILLMLGPPRTLFYQRTDDGSTVATFTFDSGSIASLLLPSHQTRTGGFEHLQIFGTGGRRIVVENNTRVFYYRDSPDPPGTGYGATPDFYTAPLETASSLWEPEFSLGQLYNKGLFIHGYYNEITTFARAILDNQPIVKGTVQHAQAVTRLFQAFAQGPGKMIIIGDES